MRRFLALCFLLLIAIAHPALAQTTFSTDCDSHITISGGGLTLTSTNSGNFVGCRASQGKQSGLVYYEATVNHAPVSTIWGVAAGGSGSGSPPTVWDTAAGFPSGNNILSAIMRQDGNSFWNNVAGTGGSSVTSGKTIGVALDLNTDPWQMWVTSDVANLVCNGSGSSGSTAPKWNGSCAKDPTLKGTGDPVGVFPSGSTAGTGLSFFITGAAVWPIWQGQVLDSSTFNFGATSFVGTVPSGYTSWNNSSGNTATPGPINPPTLNVSNAPGWAASTSYPNGYRVNAGPGWTPGSPGSYTSGSAVYAWAVLPGTGGTSGGSAPGGFASCASPANAGGGFVGSPPATPTAWTTATQVTDNGITWVCLTKVDYATLTNTFADTSVSWAATTPYAGFQLVRNAGNIYRQWNPAFDPATCISGSTGPTGSSPTNPDGTCHWLYAGALTYSSNTTGLWPTMQYFGGSFSRASYNYAPNVIVWYGGLAQQTYGPQQPGELSPILMTFHQDYWHDQDFYCYHSWGISTVRNAGGCALTAFWVTYISVPPGDSFTDNFTNSTPWRIDQTKGFTVTNTASWVGGSFGYNSTGGEPIAYSDGDISTVGIQLLSTNGITVSGHNFNGPGNQHANGLEFINDLIVSNGTAAPVTWTCDGGCVLLNTLVAGASTATGAVGAIFAYQNNILANTIILGTGAAGSTCIRNQGSIGIVGGAFYDDLCLGFTHPWAHDSGYTGPFPTPLASNNATDAVTNTAGTTYTDALGNSIITDVWPGVGSTCTPPSNASSCLGLTASNQLVNRTTGASLDARIQSTLADIYAAGISYSVPFAIYTGTAANIIDIINQTWSPRYDIGPAKFGASGPPTLTSVNLSGNTFTAGATAGTIIGFVTVSGGGALTPTLSISGANTGAFALSNPSGPTSNLTCSVSTVCPSAGSYTDTHIVATQGGATGSPCDGSGCGGTAFTITGSGGPPPPTLLRIKLRFGGQ